MTVVGRIVSTLKETVSLVEATGGAARLAQCDADEHSVAAAVNTFAACATVHRNLPER